MRSIGHPLIWILLLPEGSKGEREREKEREREREDKKVARERGRDISPFSIIASFLNIFLGFGEQSSS